MKRHRYRNQVHRDRLLNCFTKKSVTATIEQHKDENPDEWSMIYIDEDKKKQRLYGMVNAITDLNPVKMHSPILHIFDCDIEAHIDNMSKKVIILPIRVSSSMILYDEESSYSDISLTSWFTLDDSIKHGIYNPNRITNLIITVDI